MLYFRAITLSLGLLLSQVLMAHPDIIAHRGASGYLPEHTLEAATLAFAQGADYIEQDLVLSQDLVPVVLHDIHLDTVTDVALKFPSRKREDGRFYAFDFTLAELKTLKVHERTDQKGYPVFPYRYQGKGGFTIATFEEQIELITQLNRQFGKSIGLFPEIKSPAWHKQEGADITTIVFNLLRKYQLDDASKKIYVQCFDFSEIKRMRKKLGAKVKLVQLIGENNPNEPTDYEYLQTPEGLKKVAKFAQGIGPGIGQLVNLKKRRVKKLAKNAKEAGLLIYPYTFRRDALPAGISEVELLDILFKRVKVGGVFSDFPDSVVEYLQSDTVY
ncbi:MAG: glycerophosphodiester phosphodiesterase [Gammaproteobacteria bacterium]|nr:glycerophosphodiester phosphodiesterase [Gammaproteobacteria bacterium]